jgi:hypothetical protein
VNAKPGQVELLQAICGGTAKKSRIKEYYGIINTSMVQK